jgi:hypothetical protein
MVYSDYNIGNSTRIDQSRMAISDPVQARIFEATGGYLGYVTNGLGFILPSIYFWRKFNQYSLPLRLAGTVFISLQLKSMINKLAILNMGNPAEIGLLQKDFLKRSKIMREIANIDNQKVVEENSLHLEETIRQLNKK